MVDSGASHSVCDRVTLEKIGESSGVATVVVEVAAGVVVGAAVEVVADVGLVAGVGALVAAVEAAVRVVAVEAVGLVAVGLDLSVEALVVATGSSSSTCGKLHTQHRCFSRLDDAWRAEFGDEVERPRRADLLRSSVAIFDLDYDVILSAMYALSASAEGDCYRCVLPDPSIAAAALGASESGTLPGTAPAEALHTFTLDSCASRCLFRDSTTLTPLPAPVPVTLADPSGGPVVARSSTVLPCPADPSGSPVESVHICYRASSGTCVCSGFRVRSGSRLFLVSPPIAPDSSKAPLPGSPLPATPSLHALLSSCLWSSQVSASPPALACPALPSLRRGAAARRSSLLLVSPDNWPPADSPHGHDLPVLRLHSDGGGELSSNLLHDFCLAQPLPRVSLPETLPTLRWTGEVGDASVFWVWGSCAFVRDTSTEKLSACAIPCIFLGFVPDVPGWQFYHPTSRRVLPSQEVTFDESVPFYRLFPYRSAAPPPPPPRSSLLPVDPLPRTALVKVAVSSGAAGGIASGGAASGGVESKGAGSGGAKPGGVEPGGAEPEGVEPGSAESEGAESWGAASFGGPARASPRLSLQQLREWLARRARLRSGATGAGGARDAGAGGAGVTAGAGGTGGAAAAGPGGARTRGAGAARSSGAGGAGAGGAGVGGTGAGGAGAVDPGTGGAGGTGARGTERPRPYFVPLLQQFLGVPSSTSLTPPILCQPPDQSRPPLLSAFPLPATSPYTEQSSGLTERREPASFPISPVCTARRVPRLRPPPVPGTHAMALRPSSVPLRVTLPALPESSLLEVPDPESNHSRTASPTVSSLNPGSSCEAEIYAGAMAAQELRWLNYLLTDLEEQPRSPLQRGQLHLAYVATRANTADIFTKALPPGDHLRFSTVLGLVPTLPHLLTA
ncbi:unnamed protein product [Closterium sp. NIES-53]